MAQPVFDAAGNTTVAVTTHDQRPYVVSGQKRPEFIGLLRSAVGIPYNVATRSKKPLAEDFTQVISDGLRRKGFAVTPVSAFYLESGETVSRRLKDTGSRKGLKVTINEWKSDSYVGGGRIPFDLSCEVQDETGAVVARNTARGTKVIPMTGGRLWIVRDATPAVRAAQEVIEELINNREITAALR
jgi:hypothetical protein